MDKAIIDALEQSGYSLDTKECDVHQSEWQQFITETQELERHLGLSPSAKYVTITNGKQAIGIWFSAFLMDNEPPKFFVWLVGEEFERLGSQQPKPNMKG